MPLKFCEFEILEGGTTLFSKGWLNFGGKHLSVGNGLNSSSLWTSQCNCDATWVAIFLFSWGTTFLYFCVGQKLHIECKSYICPLTSISELLDEGKELSKSLKSLQDILCFILKTCIVWLYAYKL